MTRAATVADELSPVVEGSALIHADELERRRIARELHDDIGQRLALLSVEIDRFGQRPPVSAAEFQGRIQELAAQVRDLSSAVHALSRQLHPSKLEHLGLTAAIRGLCREVTHRRGIEARFAESVVPKAIASTAALCLYRVAQEALRNIVRHSGAARVTVELEGTSGGIGLVVNDDGAGFDPAAVFDGEGLGLISRRERVRLAGGRLEIDARPGWGTRINAHVPPPKQSRIPV